MKKLITPGRIMFAAGITGLGIICFIMKDFIVGRPPAWPATWNINPALAYFMGAMLIIAALAIVVNRKGRAAALLVALLIILLSLSRHLPKYLADWVNVYKTLALIGGALIVAASFPKQNGMNAQSPDRWMRPLLFAGSLLLASFFIAGGYAHFKWADGVQYLIPEYIPFRLFWTYFCGVCLFAGGIGIIIPQVRKWAALLSGIMITGWFLLLHIPRFLDDTTNVSDRMGLCESFAFAAICFVLAGMSAVKR